MAALRYSATCVGLSIRGLEGPRILFAKPAVYEYKNLVKYRMYEN